MRWDLGAALGAVLMLIVPSLLATGADSSGVLALAVVALAAAALVLVVGVDVLAARALVAVRTTGPGVTPALSGRVTDPTHHPLRPRAPGSA